MCPLEFERNMIHKVKRDLNIKKNDNGLYAADPIAMQLQNDKKYIRDRLNKLRINTFDDHLFNASQANMGVLTRDVVQKYAIENFTSEVKRHSFLDYAGPRLGYLARLGLLNDAGTLGRFYHERVIVKGAGLDRRLNREYKQDYRYIVNTSILEYIKSFRLQKDLRAKDMLKTETEHFKISNVHKFMYKFCKGGEFSLKSYRELISRKLSGENLEREMCWKKSSYEKLVRVGLFENVSENTYRVTDRFIAAMNGADEGRMCGSLTKNKKKIKEFIPGQNHIRLLRFAKNGALNFRM